MLHKISLYEKILRILPFIFLTVLLIVTSDPDTLFYTYMYFSIIYSILLAIKLWGIDLLDIDTFYYYLPMMVGTVAFIIDQIVIAIRIYDWEMVDWTVIYVLPINIFYLFWREGFIWLVLIFTMALPYYVTYMVSKVVETILDVINNYRRATSFKSSSSQK